MCEKVGSSPRELVSLPRVSGSVLRSLGFRLTTGARTIASPLRWVNGARTGQQASSKVVLRSGTNLLLSRAEDSSFNREGY